MKYKVLGKVKAGGKLYVSGDEIEMVEQEGEKLVKSGTLEAIKVVEPKVKKEVLPVQKKASPKPKVEPKKRGKKKG